MNKNYAFTDETISKKERKKIPQPKTVQLFSFPFRKNVKEKNDRQITDLMQELSLFQANKEFLILLFKGGEKKKSRSSAINPFRHRLTFDH